MRRTLALKKESLAELSPADLLAVAGAGQQSEECIDPPSGPCIQSVRVDCLISRMMYPCPTDPTMVCQ